MTDQFFKNKPDQTHTHGGRKMRTWQIVLVSALGLVMAFLVGWAIYSSKAAGAKTAENKESIDNLGKQFVALNTKVDGLPEAFGKYLDERGMGQQKPIDPAQVAQNIKVQVDTTAIAKTVVSIMRQDEYFAPPPPPQPQQMARPGIDMCSVDDQVCLSLMVKECKYPEVGRTRVVRKNGRRFYYVDCVVPGPKRSRTQPPAVAQARRPQRIEDSFSVHVHGGFPKGKDGASGSAPQSRSSSQPDSSDYVAIPVE